MMLIVASCARLVNVFICISYVTLVLATDNIFNDTLSITTRDETHGVDGLFGDFSQEFDEAIGTNTILKGQSGSFQDVTTRNHASVRLKKKRRKKKRWNQNNQRPNRPNRPNRQPNRQPSPNRPNRPTIQQSNGRPAGQETRPIRSSCFSVDTYHAIDDDIASIKNSIDNPKQRSHFLGGIVRLAAHDFMDHDRFDQWNPMGADGCFDSSHASNDGLETIWCNSCPLKRMYDEKYSFLSRADFWIASANAVIRQTSINNSLDLKDTFVWGRKDRDTCQGSGDRLPQASGCDQVEAVFLRKMGLNWNDAVALLGAHTLGRGDSKVSVHRGT